MRSTWIKTSAAVSGLVVLGAFAVAQPPPAPGGGAPGSPFGNLTRSESARFQAGLRAFLQVEDAAGGLGPVFTESSCAGCHGAGAVGGAGLRTVTRIGRVLSGRYDPMPEFGGPLIQDRGIGRVNGVNFVGEVVPPEATIVARRRTTPLFGLGLVDAVPEPVFLAIAAEEMTHTPATAGRVSVVPDVVTGEARVGRFGWKAQHESLFAFAADAYQNELGVTTPLLPDENCPQGNCDLLRANPANHQPNDADDSAIEALADFLTFLAPPTHAPPGRDEPDGPALFAAIGCADCHRPALRTGPSPTPALNLVRFFPYSDFLLHDMGSLGDGIVQNHAGPHDIRTPPLWGLRLQPSLLHDGRAKTVRDAILAHDGQGRAARDAFQSLGHSRSARLLAFLDTL